MITGITNRTTKSGQPHSRSAIKRKVNRVVCARTEYTLTVLSRPAANRSPLHTLLRRDG